MASLNGQTIASSYEQLLHTNNDGGGDGTTLVDVRDGDNGTTFALKLATDKIQVNGSSDLDGAVTINESSADVDFRVESNGNSHMLFVDAGNNRVGIGDSSPSQTLSIDVNSSTTTSAGANGIEIGNSNTTGDNMAKLGFSFGSGMGSMACVAGKFDDRSGGSETVDLIFGTIGAGSYGERMVIKGNGKVGIGTDSPSSDIHIDCGAPSSSDKTIGIFQAESSRQLGIGWDDSASEMAIGTLTNHSLAFFTNGIANPKMTLGNTGMLNIGNNDTGSAGSGLKQLSLGTSDNTALDFTNSGTIAGAIISNSSNTDDSACGVVFSHRTGSSGISYVASRNEGADRSALYFGTRGSDGVQLRMEIRNDGVIASKKGIIFDGTALGSGQTGIASSGSGGDLRIYTNGTQSTTFAANGRVGINTSSANAKLDIREGTNGQEIIYLDHTVTGSDQTFILFKHDGTSRGHIQVTDSSDQIAYNTTTSDKRLKKDFEDWNESILPAFKSLKPQLFNFIHSENNGGKRRGYIAQDNVDSFPEAYTTSKVVDGDDTEYYSFNPTGMVTYLMKAVQELSAKVEALENA